MAIRKKISKAQDGGYIQVSDRADKRAIKKDIKRDVKSRANQIIAIDPENKSYHKKMSREVLKDKKKVLRKWGIYETPSLGEEMPPRYAKKGGTVKRKK